jgi:hypothetical protein
VGLAANYYRRWYGNFFATDNLGFDVSINAAFGKGGHLAGGVSAGQTVTDE